MVNGDERLLPLFSEFLCKGDTLPERRLKPRPLCNRNRIYFLFFKLFKQERQIFLMFAFGEVGVHAAILCVKMRLRKERGFKCFETKPSEIFFPSTTAIPVSSHEVSIAKIFIQF